MLFKNRNLNKRRDYITAYSLIVPSLILIVVVVIFPLFYSFWLSLHRVNFLYLGQPFIGVRNYIEMFSNKEVGLSLLRTGYFTIVSIIIQISLGILIALFLNLNFKGRSVVRLLILLPWAIPTVVNGTLWKWILDGSTGALNHLLLQIGLIENNIIWLGHPFLAINSIILADTWRMVPLYVIMVLASLQGIPEEQYDAAKVDGASSWSIFWYVILPNLKPIILVILILRTIQIFRVFDIIYVMTRGGPANGTSVITFLTYFTSFKFQNFGLGSAMAFVIGIITLILTLIYIRAFRRIV